MADKNSPARFGDKIRFSIALKLNVRLFLRTLFAFITLDLLLCAAAAAGTAWYAEHRLASAAEQARASGFPEEDAAQWLQTQGVAFSWLSQPLKGLTPPSYLRQLLPSSTAGAVRRVAESGGRSRSVWARFDGLTYGIGLSEYGRPYEIRISLFGIVQVIKSLFSSLMMMEIVLMLGGLMTRVRIIRRTLRPIAELAETAESLNRASGDFSVQGMEDLAGKLNDINAAKLDIRIPLDSTQRELKNLAASINGMLDRINEAYRSQIRFVSDASHELRTPIAVIQGYASLLDRWGKNDEKTMQEAITAIKEETANMKLLVEQLLFLARGDNHTIRLQTERFDLAALAQEVVRETQMIDSGHEYGIRLAPAPVLADPSLIKQLMRILMDNAIKYTPSGGHISAGVRQADGFAWLTVQDDGIGIPPQAVPRIFDRFYRADESRARATGGTGLGLSIAKWIVERHGGHLEVLSRENIGTRISAALPLSSGGALPDDPRQPSRI